MKFYQSEITQFLTQLKTERPHLEKDQQKGRALLWDKQLAQQLKEGLAESNVVEKPYVYQTT